MQAFVRRVRTYVQHHGAAYTLRRACEKLRDRLTHEYEHCWQRDKAGEAELQRERQTPVEGVGLISIVVPVYNTDPRMLMELAASFVAQTYPDWEACLYDGMSTRTETKEVLARLVAMDSRFHVKTGERNEGISGNSNRAAEMAQGSWIALCDHDDLLTPDALYRVAEVIRAENPDLIYSDEDKVSEDSRMHMEPHYKPDFSPDNLNSGNYVCHLMVMRKALLKAAGGFRPAFDGSQDHDLTLRCTEHTKRIAHIPRVLYHWRQVGGSMSHQNLMRCVEAARKAVEEHIGRMGWSGRVTAENGTLRLHYDIKGSPKVSVIVMDSGDDTAFARCLSALQQTDWQPIEWLVVGRNQAHANMLQARWVDADVPVHRYAAMNVAVKATSGEVVAFVDTAVTMRDPSWLREMLMYAQRDDVGAVTPVLCTSKGHITHAGFALGLDGIAQGRSRGLPLHAGGWHNMMGTSHNVGAVSAACFMVRKDHYLPMDEAYASGLGAVDWCVRLGKMGYHHVYTPFAVGECIDKALLLDGTRRNPEDAAHFCALHGEQVSDPCYSQHFSRHQADFSLRKDT